MDKVENTARAAIPTIAGIRIGRGGTNIRKIPPDSQD